MKNIFYILLFSVISFTNAQFFSANHFVLNEGTESDYLKLEQIWKEFHQESVDNGNKLGWAVFKVNTRDNKAIDNVAYIVFNFYESQAQIEKEQKNWENQENAMAYFNSVVKRRLKGKMSSSFIRKILAKDPKIKKNNYQWNGQIIDATPLVGGSLKPGDKLRWGGGEATSDDYEQLESEVWKPIVMETILKGDQKQWLLSKITYKNEALEEVAPPFTHVYFNLYDKDSSAPNTNATPDWDFKTQKLVDLLNNSINRNPGWTASFVMSTN